MSASKRHGLLLSLLVAGLSAGGCLAQGYPSKVVRIFTGPVGSSSDLLARLVSAELTVSLGQPAVVENRPGGVPLFGNFLKNPADGYALLVAGAAWGPGLMEAVPFDALKDFAPVVALTRTPIILFVHPSLPVKSVKELIALAKSKAKLLNYSTGSTGSSTHLAGEFLKAYAGVDIVRIPYNSQALQVADSVTGQVQMSFSLGTPWMGALKAGKLRALATTGATRSVLLPDLPMMAETFPEFIVEQIQAMYAPAKTPEAIIARLNQEALRALAKPQARERLLLAGLEPEGGPPEHLTEYAKADIARVAKMIKDLGGRLDRSGS